MTLKFERQLPGCELALHANAEFANKLHYSLPCRCRTLEGEANAEDPDH